MNKALFNITFCLAFITNIKAQQRIPAELDSATTKEKNTISLKSEPLPILKEKAKKEQQQPLLNGYFVLFNKNHQKTKDGIFKNNRLINGKNYMYDLNGTLYRIEEYKDGAYIGNLPIDKN
jgi:hypothetical protein